MCTNCGCSVSPQNVVIDGKQDHKFDHHHHQHHHNHSLKTLKIHQSILAKNDHLAQHNRDLFTAKNTYVFNILSSPSVTDKIAIL